MFEKIYYTYVVLLSLKKKKKRNGKGSYSNKDKYSIIQTPNILFRFIIVLAQNIKWFKRLRSWCLQCCMTGRILLWPFFHPKYPLIWNGKGKCLSSLLSGKIEQTCGCSSDVLRSSSNSSSPRRTSCLYFEIQTISSTCSFQFAEILMLACGDMLYFIQLLLQRCISRFLQYHLSLSLNHCTALLSWLKLSITFCKPFIQNHMYL